MTAELNVFSPIHHVHINYDVTMKTIHWHTQSDKSPYSLRHSSPFGACVLNEWSLNENQVQTFRKKIYSGTLIHNKKNNDDTAERNIVNSR